MYANEPRTACPRVIGQYPRRRKSRSVAQPWGTKMDVAVFVCLLALVIALSAYFVVR